MTTSNNAFAIDLTTAFYDVMFGKSDEAAETLNPLEQAVCDDVSRLLEHRDISSLVPPLPAQIIQITNAVNDDSTDFRVLQGIIETDVALAGEIISKANTPAFRRTEKPTENIQEAVASLGLSGVADIANNILMKRVLDIKPIYFKMFGQQIWDHSDECAVLCRFLADDYDPGLCYLLGLLHDVGKVVMFKSLVDAFTIAHPEHQPGGKLFKDMMIQYSLWLSWRVAESWDMPESIVGALKQQRYDAAEGLGVILLQGNFLSEMNMLAKVAQIDLEEMAAIFGQKGLSEEKVAAAFQLIRERDGSSAK